MQYSNDNLLNAELPLKEPLIVDNVEKIYSNNEHPYRRPPLIISTPPPPDWIFTHTPLEIEIRKLMNKTMNYTFYAHNLFNQINDLGLLNPDDELPSTLIVTRPDIEDIIPITSQQKNTNNTVFVEIELSYQKIQDIIQILEKIYMDGYNLVQQSDKKTILLYRLLAALKDNINVVNDIFKNLQKQIIIPSKNITTDIQKSTIVNTSEQLTKSSQQNQSTSLYIFLIYLILCFILIVYLIFRYN